MSCRLVRRHMGAYVDAELDPTTQIEFERHVSACAGCQEMLSFEQSFRSYLREAAGGESSKAPAHLTLRVREALREADEERAQTQQANNHRRGGVRFLPLRARYAVPAAAAATLLLFAGMSPFEGEQNEGNITRAGATPSLKDVVRLHSNELPADVRGQQPEQVADYFRRKAGEAVRPVRFGRKDVRLTGARLYSVRDGRAPAFYYDVYGRRVTVVAFDEPTRPFGNRGMKIRLGGRELFYQQVGGYVVPVRRHAGRSYAFTGDLDRETLLQLAASSRLAR